MKIISFRLASLILSAREPFTIVAHGRAVITSLKAADILAREHGVSVEVVDLRSIRPLDEETILNSVRKTHRALLVEENKPFCGVDAQIA
jgi:pyruvate dehydrogenase E1 component beta subunit